MNFEDRYDTFDRILHRIAFRAGTAQHALSDVENVFFRDRLDEVSVTHPVFITALPRSGTTILLKVLWQTKQFATHTYQDMPFVLCPLFWNRYTRQFSGEVTAVERAHGDGLTVSGTSPEAFEEMIWKHFWPSHYQEDRIRPWTEASRNEEFNRFFETHMRKILAIRSNQTSDGARYLSKNNLTISRLAHPPGPLREGTFLVPFRDPIQQAASMLRQHKRFLSIQREDDFVREYMEAIGHHEFGKSLKPVNFGGWLQASPDPEDLLFWVRYWRVAYQHVLHHEDDSTVLVSYERLTDEPKQALDRLGEVVDVPSSKLAGQAGRLHPPRTHEVNSTSLPESLLRNVTNLYQRLQRKATV